MSDQVRRGRRVVLVYITASVFVMLVLAAGGMRRRRRTGRLFVRLFTHAMLLHSLWRGSRWARALHVLGLAVLGAWTGMMCSRMPDPILRAVLGGVTAVCVITASLLAFSRDVRAFLASQRGERIPEPFPFEPATVAPSRPSPGRRREELPDEESLSSDFVSCGRCGTPMKSFVVCCPDCGARRD